MRSARRYLALAIIAVGLSVAAMAPAAAQALDPDLPRRLDTLMSDGRYDEARDMLRQAVRAAPDADIHIAHFEGLILVRQERYDEAIEAFRGVLSRAPNFVPSRIELARTLYRAGQTDAAAFHFDAINLGADDVGLKRLAQGYLDRIRSEKPWGVGGYFGLLPTTNVNRGTDNTTFESALGVGTIAQASRRSSGLGFAGGVNGFREVRFGEGSAVNFAGSVDIRKYLNTDIYDEATFTATVSFTQRWKESSFRIGPTGEYTLGGWQPHVQRYGVALGGSTRLSARAFLYANMTVLRQKYATQGFRDGWLAMGSATIRHMISPSVGMAVSTGFLLERTAARADLDHDDIWVRLQVDKEWEGGVLSAAHIRYGHHAYMGNFPTTLTPRRDHRLSVGGRLSHRRFNVLGFAPQLTYEFTRQFSNIAFYDYQSHDVGLSFTSNY